MRKKSKKKNNKVKPVKKNFRISLIPKEKLTLYFLFAALLTGYFFITLSNDHIQDDTYIFLRYVQNFNDGNGLVFNNGEYVEGYTGFFWLVLLIIISKLGIDLVSTTTLVSIVFGSLVLLFTYKLSSSIIPYGSQKSDDNKKEKKLYSSLFNIFPVLLVGLNGAFHYWASSGMETMLFTSLLTAGFYYYFRTDFGGEQSYKFALFFALASLTRPEGLMVSIILIVHNWVIKFFSVEKKFAKSFRAFFTKEMKIALAIIFIPTIVFIIFRLVYYGYPLPNTYYAKAGISGLYLKSGLQYFFNFSNTYMLYGTVFIFPFLLLRGKKMRREVSLLLSIVLIYSIYIIIIGGDVLPVHRFFIPILPLIYIVFSKFLQFFYVQTIKYFNENKSLPFLVLILVISGFSYFTFITQIDYFKYKGEMEKNLVQKMSATGKWFNFMQSRQDKKITVAASTIGALSYYSESTIIDMLGLTDVTIAHYPQPIKEISDETVGWKERNYNVDYVLSRKPDYIFFSTGIKPSAYAERALFTSKKFLKEYYPYLVYYPPEKLKANIYKRKPEEVIGASSFETPTNPNYSAEFINLYTNAINLLGTSEQLENVFIICRELQRIAPYEFSETYRLMAEVYSRRGDDSLAFINYQKSLKIDTFNTNALGSLLGYAMTKRDTAQVEYYSYLLKRINPDILTMYGIPTR